ncbi:MAG: FAD-dependent oxidoreductase [Deltaproteobacteria bacterium]|jgi:heterodisulfide reductase subunit A-like polyferredoxin|nr:FAD-dependent oxidoreductase [Deltaproteobacteria bacterium]
MDGNQEKSGAVLVLGGGIAGVQASLDLAESGFYVYLADRNPAVGGRMAQLDKVFPTDDCSMCIVSPKLNDSGGHVNVETLNLAELLELNGGPGRFKAKVKISPRYLDGAKCTVCGDCAAACPVSLPSEFNQGLGPRKAVFKSYPQAVPNAFSLSKGPVSPSVASCPAHVNAHAYVSLAAEGRYREALEVILDALPLPGSLGRVCAHPCESECRRSLLEGPLAIRDIKRLVADRADIGEAGAALARSEPKEARAAIVGAGPAGLSCAYHLARAGISSTIFEAEKVSGGALRLGIPDYRLPPEILRREIEFVSCFSGCETRHGKALGRDFSIDSLFADGFKAVFLAMGAWNPVRLDVPGEDLPGVVAGLEFLKSVNLGKPPDLKGKTALVVGGGNTALDAARSALRLGADVTLAYRRGKAAMPAWGWEVDEALEEGVELLEFRAPLGFEKAGKAGNPGRLLARLARAVPIGDPSDRRAPLKLDRRDLIKFACDIVVSAAGQSPSSEALRSEPLVRISARGAAETDPVTLETGRPGVFAGGDLQLGPAQAIDAVAAGKEAAVSISRLFEGRDLREGRERISAAPDSEYREIPDRPSRIFRAKPALRPVSERILDFGELGPGLTDEEALLEASRCLACGLCSRCMRCAKACLPGALTAATHAQAPEIRELDVGAVVLAPGFDPHDPSDALTLRYADCPNVVTSLEFERILSASGPFAGVMRRPGDGREPGRMAWIQCVGSRDENVCGNSWCSAVCCMSAMKEARVAMEHAGGPGRLAASIFYMDARCHGKDFENYFIRAREAGLRFVRSRIHTLTPLPSGDLSLDWIDPAGNLVSETFDMAVLSVGVTPPAGLKELAGKAGVSLNAEGFIRTLPFEPEKTTRAGVFVCGAASEPKDIPASVCEASAAAGSAAGLLASARGSRARERGYPDERDTASEIPRIGVFVCRCGINIASVVDVDAVKEYASSLPFVELSSDSLFTCSADSQARISDAVRELGLNRVVVASCSPRTHEAMFRETLAQAGLNRYLFEMANIRDQDSWVHRGHPEKATRKAMDLVRAAVAKAALLEPLRLTRMGVFPEALVVGGGAAGLTAALSIAAQGFKAHLVEKSASLGGRARELFLRDRDAAAYVGELARKAESDPLVEIHLESFPENSEGFLGNFETRIKGPGGTFAVKHGATVLACGGRPHVPGSYLYGRHPRVLLSLDVDRMLAENDPALARPGVAFCFIQCVESRCGERPYCSRTCCSHSIESALTLLDRNPTASAWVLYRDIRTYGFREKLYREARSRGVRFARYEEDAPPILEPLGDARLRVTVRDHVLGRPIELTADWLALATGIDPAPMKEEIAEVFKAQLNAEGFLLEAHMKLRPVDLATDGQFLAGLAHYPKPLDESIAQARAAAARASALLSKPFILTGGAVAECDPSKCAACLTCLRSCPVKVPKIVPNEEDPALPGHAFMEPAICQGCGVCVSECPAKAIRLKLFTDEQLLAKIAALASGAADRPPLTSASPHAAAL